MKSSTLIAILLAVVLGVLYFSGSIAGFLTDWKWFAAIGQPGVFRTTVLARVGLGAVSALIAFAVLQGNAVWALRQTAGRRLKLGSELADSPIGRWLQNASATRIATIGSAVVAVMIGLGASAFWRDFLLFLHGGPFGYTDPVLSLDAGFYVFTLPFLQFGRGILLALIVLSTLLAAVVYGIRGAIQLDIAEVNGQVTARGVEITPAARTHLGVLFGAWLALIAAGTLLARYGVLFDQSGLISGPTETQATITLPLMLIQALLTLAAAGLVAWGVVRSRTRLWLGGLVLTVVAAVATALVPNAYQQLVVLPNELEVERPHIESHIEATRRAFALNEVGERDLSGEAELDWGDIQANQPTVKNIRLWDHQPLLETFSQVQEIRTYYNFPSVDNDRYMVDGELRQIMLSPRELQPASLPARARTWVNETMVYTHGYGLTLGPVNEITPQGLPRLWIKDLPPEVEHAGDLDVDEPALYFGESMRTEVFVNTDNEEFDYPSGEENAYSNYEGVGGVDIGNMLWKSMWAIRMGSSKILLTGDIRRDSRVLLYRNVAERVQEIAPFLLLDRDPYLTIAEGKLVWILDAYTTTTRFPYAQRVAGLSYMRNSVKVTVDAYDGTVTFYEVDRTDPILQAWASIFPNLFTPGEEMPEAIREHIRYPQDYFSVQAHLFATYHMTDPQMFYNREDEWEVPVVNGSQMQPYYTVMKIPEEDREEFIVMLPFVPRNKPNLAAWMVARSDGEHYGQVLAYAFPKDKMIYGPTMIVARFNQDDVISEKLSLWNQQGSQVRLGTLLVIPIEESLIYVQPLYLRADSGSIPELKRVLVGYQNEIAMEPTLDMALRKLFDEPVTTAAADQPTEGEAGEAPVRQAIGTVLERARSHYEQSQEAIRQGDWATFGEQLDRLGEALLEMKSEVKPGDEPTDETPGTGDEVSPEPATGSLEGAEPVTPDEAPLDLGAGGG